ncbi:hypothetical protein N7532_002608 [Penicillium argentinense]|uniref:Uncharacterized protein n=1 Tax=Penicillium argentinense TaxID=1131581 RepID=A0A9W9KLM2_9EURO|nr:uncharacterized protein N7532_002608 [Penicillium argentinense]KAJ5109963.1 hypothetical protein N7532_002608 [Penicillium argentinense]
MFGGKQAVSLRKWRKKNPDEQLQSAKSMGMVFEYMNDPKVWEKFCDTYEAIYNRLGEFDDFSARNNRNLPKIQEEWPIFIDVVLSSMANRSKGTFNWMFRKRKYVLDSKSLLQRP